MLTNGVIHSELSRHIALLRHTDRFVVSDAGLPVPSGVPVVDLAFAYGSPRFTDVLDAVLPGLVLQGAVLAEEARGTEAESWVMDRLPGVALSYVPHDGEDGFKASVREASFVIRTGETTSFANVILEAGVPF